MAIIHAPLVVNSCPPLTRTVDPTLFTDPSGFTLNGDTCVYTNDDDEQQVDGQCEYHYAASDCDSDGKCQKFTLTADMETEADYQKKSE